MTDWGLKTISRALLIETDMPMAEMRRFAGVRRRVSKEERARIVAECEQPGVCLTTVARRNRVPLVSLRRWVRLAGGPGAAKLEREDLAAQPPFVPVVVDDLPPAEAVEIEAAGVVVRLPADCSVVRIAAVAAYLGRLA